MNLRRTVAIAAAGTAAAVTGVALHRATHPDEARWLDDDDGGRRPDPVDPARFVLPPGVVHHELPTPDGGVVHAIEAGAGRPLVLLHGVTLRSEVWAPQFHQLADEFRVIAADLRGHGRSVAGTDGFGMAQLGADLATLLIELDLHDAIVVGHSMGGMTAMAFCGDHRDVLAERVAGLVFVATSAKDAVPPVLDGTVRRLVAHGQARIDAGRELPARATVTAPLARLAFGDRPSPTAVGLVTEMGQSMAPEALLPSLSGVLDHDAREALAQTDTPSLVVVGTRDLLTPVPSGRHLARLLPDADFVVLRRCGHQIMQERPDELAELLRAFDRRLKGDASVADAVDEDPGPVTSDQVERPVDGGS